MTVILSLRFAEVKIEFEIKMKFDNTVLFWQNQSALQHKLAFTQIHTDLHTNGRRLLYTVPVHAVNTARAAVFSICSMISVLVIAKSSANIFLVS